MKTLLLLLSIIALASCKQRSLTKTEYHEKTTTSKDSTIETTTVEKIDTVVIVRGDSSTAVIDVPQDTTVKVINTDTQEVNVSVRGGKLTVKSKVKDRAVHVDKQKVTHQKATVSTASNTTITKKEKTAEKRYISFGWIWFIIVPLVGFLLYRYFPFRLRRV